MAKDMATVTDLSDYYYGLKDSETRARYKPKLSLFGGQDPYVLASRKLLNQYDPFPDFK